MWRCCLWFTELRGGGNNSSEQAARTKCTWQEDWWVPKVHIPSYVCTLLKNMLGEVFPHPLLHSLEDTTTLPVRHIFQVYFTQETWKGHDSAASQLLPVRCSLGVIPHHNQADRPSSFFVEFCHNLLLPLPTMQTGQLWFVLTFLCLPDIMLSPRGIGKKVRRGGGNCIG